MKGINELWTPRVAIWSILVVIIGLGSALLPYICQAITWTNADILSMTPQGKFHWVFFMIFVMILEDVVSTMANILSRSHCIKTSHHKLLKHLQSILIISKFVKITVSTWVGCFSYFCDWETKNNVIITNGSVFNCCKGSRISQHHHRMTLVDLLHHTLALWRYIHQLFLYTQIGLKLISTSEWQLWISISHHLAITA